MKHLFFLENCYQHVSQMILYYEDNLYQKYYCIHKNTTVTVCFLMDQFYYNMFYYDPAMKWTVCKSGYAMIITKAYSLGKLAAIVYYKYINML